MSTAPTTPLSTIAADTTKLTTDIKTAAAQLSTDARSALTQALADAHQELVDIKGEGATVWSALLAALGKAPASATK